MWAAVYCWTRRRPLIVWWEGIPLSDGTERAADAPSQGVVAAGRSGYGANGVESARSLERYGVPTDRIDLGMTGTDTVHWASAVDHERATTRATVRDQLGLEGAVLLFVGRLVPLKEIPELLRAMTALRRSETCLRGVCSSSGPARPRRTSTDGRLSTRRSRLCRPASCNRPISPVITPRPTSSCCPRSRTSGASCASRRWWPASLRSLRRWSDRPRRPRHVAFSGRCGRSRRRGGVHRSPGRADQTGAGARPA